MGSVFPDPNNADENGIVASGGNFSSQLLIEAYKKGIFPWPHEGHPKLWFSPDPRGVIYTNKLHLSKSLKKWIRRNPLAIAYNKSFDEVIKECKSQPRKGQDGTWITDDLEEGYRNFHHQGFAYSAEAYQEGKLVAGLYGVMMGGFISAESMFHRTDNASKALLYLFLRDMEHRGVTLVDCQMLTPTTEALGGTYISRNEFLMALKPLTMKKKPILQGFSSKDVEL
tara:strand:- start:979 stop:1656 length:678 start_codon:yes stop_codon:yes gene_type:complete